jgi:predicted permease
VIWWQRLWKRRQAENRLDAELTDHIERLVADNIAQGMSADDARRDARLTFGGLDQIKETCRDARGTQWFHDFAYDLRFAFRGIGRDPWFTVVVVVSLALGIGVCSMAFTITDAYFLRGLPVERPNRLFHVGTTDAQGNDQGVSWRDYLDWRTALPDVDMAAFHTGQVSIADAGSAADRVSGAYVTADVFRLLGVDAPAGRVWSRDDELAGRTAVALLSHRLWTTRYGADASFTSRTILVDGVPTVVIGVMPDGFGFPSQQQIWLPLAEGMSESAPDRSDRSLAVLANIRDDQNVEAVTSARRALAANLASAYPATNAGIDVDLIRFGQHQVGELRSSPALMLPIAAAIILLIACTNVANLLLARSGTRTRELAVRASLGAARGRIVRQLLAESLLLAGLGGLAGFGIATLAVDAVAASFFDGYVPYWMTFTANGRSLAAAGTFSVLSTILFGLAPALRASQRGAAAHMRTGVRSGLVVPRDPWSARLVAIQFALSVVLLGGAGLLVSSYSVLLRVDDVIDAGRFTTMRIELPEEAYVTDDRRTAFYRRFEADVGSIPGVEAVALASVAPFLGASSQRVTIRGRGTDSDVSLATGSVSISSAYFETLGVALLRGSSFNPEDSTYARTVAIVNELFAERHFAGQDPLGRQIRVEPAAEPGATGSTTTAERTGGAEWLTVIGIAPTIRQAAPGGPRPLIYLPQHSAPALSAQVLLRMPTASASTIAEIRRRAAAIDNQVVLANVRPLAETLRNSRLQPQLIATVLGSLSLVALFLSTVGLYAITAHGVRQRTAEIGLRLALGGRPAQVIWLFMRRGLTPIVVGLVLGLAGAFGVGQVLRGLLIGTSATDPATFAALSLLLTTVTAVACFVPAQRGTRVDPVSTLRQD